MIDLSNHKGLPVVGIFIQQRIFNALVLKYKPIWAFFQKNFLASNEIWNEEKILILFSYENVVNPQTNKISRQIVAGRAFLRCINTENLNTEKYFWIDMGGLYLINFGLFVSIV